MLLIQFICLQLLDAVTTMVFLNRGVAEANPLVGAALRISLAHPELPLALVKLAGIGAALYAYRSGRRSMLRRINLLFAVCVLWNLAAIVVA